MFLIFFIYILLYIIGSCYTNNRGKRKNKKDVNYYFFRFLTTHNSEENMHVCTSLSCSACRHTLDQLLIQGRSCMFYLC